MDFSQFIIANQEARQTKEKKPKVSKPVVKKVDYVITIRNSSTSDKHIVSVMQERDKYVCATAKGNKERLLKVFLKEYKRMGTVIVKDLTNED